VAFAPNDRRDIFLAQGHEGQVVVGIVNFFPDVQRN
jgi:hypothetical protein